MALPVLPAPPAAGVGGAGAAGVTKAGFQPLDGAAQPFFRQAVNDVYRIELRWQLPNLVSASNILYYRQVDDLPGGEDPASYLVQLLVQLADTPVHDYLDVVASTCSVVCAIVNNQSEDVDFTSVFDITNRQGKAGADNLSPQVAVPMRIQDANFRKKSRKTVYWPGIDEANTSRGHLTLGAQNTVNQAFQAMGQLTDTPAGGGGLEYFRLQYSQIPADGPWVDAAGVHAGCWFTRQKGRNSALC